MFQKDEDQDKEFSVRDILKDLQKEIKEIHLMAQKTEEHQIKGDSQINEVLKSITFLNNQYEKYEQERKEKDEIIKKLQEDVHQMSGKINKPEEKVDRHEQYSRRNYLLIHGAKEEKDEDTDSLVMDIVKNELKEEINILEIDRSHRIGKKSSKARPIIVKFSRYNSRKKVFSNKKKLKGTNVSVTESLTKYRMGKLQEAREIHGFCNVWTFDGRVLVKGSDEKITIYYA